MQKILRATFVSSMLLLLAASTALADGTTGDPGINPGVRLGEWLQRNVTALFAPILAVVAIYYLARRQFTRFLSFAVFAVAASLFIFGAGEFKDAALSFTRWVLGR